MRKNLSQTRQHAFNSLRAQASLEFLIIFCACLAFFALLAPQYNAAQKKASFAAISLAEESAFSRVMFAAGEAAALAPGTQIGGEIALPANSTVIGFDYALGEIFLSFAHGESEKTFSQAARFSAEFSFPGSGVFSSDSVELAAGKYSFSAKNREGGVVEISFERRP